MSYAGAHRLVECVTLINFLFEGFSFKISKGNLIEVDLILLVN